MSATSRTCVVCMSDFELLPGKPGFANRCPACSSPKPVDPAALRAAERDRKKAVIQSAMAAESSRKERAVAIGRMGTAEIHEDRIAKLRKLKSDLG